VFCDGQILGYTDMVGLTVGFNPRFVRKYDNLYERIQEAVSAYGNDVRTQMFPSEDESY